MAELSAEEKYQLYSRLMAAIFGGDPRFPICYPYIIEEERQLSLEEGMKKTLETLPEGYSHRWTRADKIQLINLRFGLEDGKPRTLREIARIYKVSPERIRQIEATTLRQLRHPSRSKLLKIFLIPKPEEMKEEIQRISQLEEENRRLEEENRELREENERIRSFLKLVGIEREGFDAKKRDRDREALWQTLKKAASRHSQTSLLLTRVYRHLLKSGITSLSQLGAWRDLQDEKGLPGKIRNLGEKSLRLIDQALEMAEEEFPPVSLVKGLFLTPEQANMPIEELQLSFRGYSALKRSGYMTVGQVLASTENNLLALRNFGLKSLEELKNALRLKGLLPEEAKEKEVLPEVDVEELGWLEKPPPS